MIPVQALLITKINNNYINMSACPSPWTGNSLAPSTGNITWQMAPSNIHWYQCKKTGTETFPRKDILPIRVLFKCWISLLWITGKEEEMEEPKKDRGGAVFQSKKSWPWPSPSALTCRRSRSFLMQATFFKFSSYFLPQPHRVREVCFQRSEMKFGRSNV